MDAEQIHRVRQFNRTVTERVGVLHERYLGLGRPVGEARLLWEIGEQGCEVRELRERLGGLDSGYVSRLLRALEGAGLVTVGALERDRRVRTVRLTDAGRAERDVLDRRSDRAAAALLEPLDDSRRDRLVAAMGEVERLLTAATVTVDAVDPGHPDAEHCLRAYYAELAESFESGFDPVRSLLPDTGELRSPQGVFLVARLHGEPVGCAGMKLLPGAPAAEIKRMWVDPRTRGLGLGRRFLAELETRAAGRGFDTVRLDTNRALSTAVGLYHSCGFQEVAAFNDEPYAHHWFEKRIGG
ncbi:putative transcriptional regulator, MarR family protein [Streptomyces spiroverticillatus]|uniref:Transcriptional regulator, MarR family protein n=1 Tax=Streptomyces finlayi TaxID=67296 RepID=A0A918X2S9_9ACTN|nr:bifunctional helix-turn-helix transcriptional regulator/GNAT family N-acetyltransferase [Streptomyces finlayi]GHA23488.1 putative transcriptional regulator, MarR family protein [Streptomyces spiroverticillatus]GHD04822.1 putative transcriptional regulator, MarR family protein [Streptomyces finlayi]